MDQQTAIPANVVPFGPEAQILEAVALTVSHALRDFRVSTKNPHAARAAWVQLDTAANLLRVLTDHVAQTSGQTPKTVSVSPCTEDALRSVVHVLGGRVVEVVRQASGPLGLDQLVGLGAEIREARGALEILLRGAPTIEPALALG